MYIIITNLIIISILHNKITINYSRELYIKFELNNYNIIFIGFKQN